MNETDIAATIKAVAKRSGMHDVAYHMARAFADGLESGNCNRFFDWTEFMTDCGFPPDAIGSRNLAAENRVA